MNNLKTKQDEELVLLFGKGNSEAFGVLITRYNNTIKTILFNLLKDRDLAEDLTQDAWVRAMESLIKGTYTDTGKFKSWISRIARNLAMDYFRKVKRTPPMVTHIFTGSQTKIEAVDTLTDTEKTGEEVLILNQSKKMVGTMLDQLPEDQREVIILRAYGGMSFAEIAATTQCSINTCLGRMRYGLINLRKILFAQAG